MPVFRFRLERVLDYREKREELLQQELAALVASLARAEAELDRMIGIYRNAEGELKKKRTPQSLDLKEIEAYKAFLVRMKSAILAQRKRVVEIEGEVERKRNELIAASKDRKILEKLKDRHRNEHRLGEDRAERRFLDEIAIGRFIREGGPAE